MPRNNIENKEEKNNVPDFPWFKAVAFLAKQNVYKLTIGTLVTVCIYQAISNYQLVKTNTDLNKRVTEILIEIIDRQYKTKEKVDSALIK